MVRRCSTHRAVVVLWANIAAFLAPLNLVEANAADLAQCLMGGFVHACSNHSGSFINSDFSWAAEKAQQYEDGKYLVGMACSLQQQTAGPLIPQGTADTVHKQTN